MDMAQLVNENKKYWSDIVFVDDIREEEFYYDSKVYKFNDILQLFDKRVLEFIIAIGNPKDRETIYHNLQSHGCQLGTLIHPNSFISPTAQISPGVIVEYQAMISSNVIIGANTIIANYAMVGHDSQIRDHSFVSSGCFIGGNCIVGYRTYLAPKVTLKNKIKVGDDSIIALAAAVFQDIPSEVVAIGNPARPMKRKDDDDMFL